MNSIFDPLYELRRAAQAVDGMNALARSLDVAPSTPRMWIARGVIPAEYCPAIERATRAAAKAKNNKSLIVYCEDLRPDVDWGVLRRNK